jgi:hypothetical protein
MEQDQDYSEFRPSRIWKRMGADRRQQAAAAFWQDEQSAEQQIEAVGAIAGAMKFRPKSVIALPLERKAKYLASLPVMPDTIAARALVSYHLEHQRTMMGAFLDSLGITHENGLINEDTVPKLEPGKVRGAAEELAAKYPGEDVSLYFSTLVSQDPETWTELATLPHTGVVRSS